MVLPAELLSVGYAEPVRRWLRRRFKAVHREGLLWVSHDGGPSRSGIKWASMSIGGVRVPGLCVAPWGPLAWTRDRAG